MLRAQVVSKLKVQEFEAGEMIIEEGTEGTSMYIIEEGQADVLVNASKVSEMASHSFFGEVAMINAQIRTATVPNSLLPDPFIRLAHTILA